MKKQPNTQKLFIKNSLTSHNNNNNKTLFSSKIIHSFIHSFILIVSFLFSWWMAKNNKYASINFNHIYDKSITTNTHNNKPSPSPSPSLSSSSYSSASYSAVSAPNKHGRILVLTRPKPISHPTPKSSPAPTQHNPIQQVPDRTTSESGSDPISLRPLGRTGVGSSFSTSPVLNNDKDKEFPISLGVKPGKFVPPHLRPGFVPKGEALGLESGRRPKSGGQERMRRGVGLDMVHGNGNRPNSSG